MPGGIVWICGAGGGPGPAAELERYHFCVKNEIFLTVIPAGTAATAAKLPSVRQRRLMRQQFRQELQLEIFSFFPKK